MSKTAAIEESIGVASPGHPRGLYVLFSAEMWERFSYYGMRAILVLYLTKRLGYARPDALYLYASYTGLVYLTPLLGGFLADRYLGQRKAIFVGGLLMALGHFVMAFEPYLYMALGLIILGNGFFKPNISTMVGQLYPVGDARRDSGYTIFYMGINLGAAIAPLVCGALAENPKIGWHYGFGAAGVGMVLGLLTFLFLQHSLGKGGYPPGRDAENPQFQSIDIFHVLALTLLGVGSVYIAMKPMAAISTATGKYAWLVDLSYWVLLALGYSLLTRLICGKTQKSSTAVPVESNGDYGRASRDGTEADPRQAPFTMVDLQRIFVILIVALFSIVFWMAFEQAGGTLTLFADQKTHRVVFGREFPASWYQSVNPFLIIAIAPLASLLWNWVDRTRYALPSSAKMGLGLVILGLGVVIMAYADKQALKLGKVGPQWLAFVYLMYSLGEICLSPIGLSLVNKLAHPKVASIMMALWFLCTAAANFLAGRLEHLLESSGWNLWNVLIFTSLVPGVLLLAMTPLLKKMGHGRL